MAHFMVQGTYSQQGVKGLLKDGGTARVQAIAELTQSLGARLESFYFTYGSDDFVCIIEGTDNIGQIAAMLLVGASGALTNMRTTVLLTADEVDEATKRTGTYRPPGA
jgi:uncharacterized protein with GYD domain